MRAVLLDEFGPADNLRLDDVAEPEPAPGQVRIAVRASGIHLLDVSLRAGKAGGPIALPELPTVPGREVAGTVDAVGSGVDTGWIGRRVVAHLGGGGGGYAEKAVVTVDALHELAADVADETAVAMIGTGRTALAVLDVAALTADDVVLVTSAAGGLGSLFVQAGRAAGAYVVGLAGSGAKLKQVEAQGADLVVDYRKPGWVDVVRAGLGTREVTVALDGVGGADGRAAFDLLGIGGRFVMYGYASGAPTQFDTSDLVARGLTATWTVGPRVLRAPGALRALETRALAAAAAGTMTPVVQTFALADAAAAHRALEERAAVGKIVLTP